MATKKDGDANRCTVQWKIENVSHCWWLKEGKRIESPSFTIDELEGTKWSLWLYLMGYSNNEVCVDLHREEDCKGPDEVEVEYHLAFLGKDGSILIEEKDAESFERNATVGLDSKEDSESVLVTDREKFLPEDTLMVQCTLWKPEKERSSDVFENSKLLYAQTVINVNRKYFDWRIEEFSYRQSGLTKKFISGLIEFHLILNDSAQELSINIISFHDCIKYISFNTSIRDTEGKKTSCGINRYFIGGDFGKEMLLSSMVTLPTMFLENRNRYLPNDVMTLSFDIVLSTVEHSVSRKDSAQVAGQEKSENTAVLIQDLKSMYNERFLCDTELRTQTQTFPAHKNILGARSPELRWMLSHDVKEYSGHIDITDLEDVTVHQMLQFMYTGSVENLQLESASKLYAAAIKYRIYSLKSVCSTFLLDNLCPTTVCDVLVLSDRHHDDHLKNAVQVYILEHDEVFRSLEWKHFMDTNIHLAADIMYMKVNPDNI